MLVHLLIEPQHSFFQECMASSKVLEQYQRKARSIYSALAPGQGEFIAKSTSHLLTEGHQVGTLNNCYLFSTFDTVLERGPKFKAFYLLKWKSCDHS